MQRVVFYSWQSDLPNATNRGLIQKALEGTAEALAQDLEVTPVIDRDTAGVPGSPDIARTIFRKIDTAAVFVADVSLVNPASSERRTPNPNVLIELGYAFKTLGEDRVVLVFNEAFGRPEELPFDLKMRRLAIYRMPESATDRATERKRLTGIFREAIKAALAAIPSPAQAPPVDPVATAITAIETVAPNRYLQVRRAMADVITDLEAIAPPLFRNDGLTVDGLIAALDKTIPIVIRFATLASLIAAMDDTEAAKALFRAFERVFAHYDNPRGFSGTSDRRDFDYWNSSAMSNSQYSPQPSCERIVSPLFGGYSMMRSR